MIDPLNRRELLRNMAIGAAVGATMGGSAVAALPTPIDAGPWELFNPLRPGVEAGLGWTLGALSELDRGAWVLNLHHADGRSARVHLCYHQGRPRGVGHSAYLDLILMDGGDGAKDTDESLGRVLRHLANVIRENESRPGADELIASLLTHGERVERFGPETLL
ncbi:MAG: hypothetical protein H6739_05295 [Alphaproteobacteria bacterium]|nr:hypothetical protein [Alphaproteobacteria bacterium]